VSAQKKQETLKQMKGISFDLNEAKIFEGKGCEDCRFTGYHGRTGIHEILLITEDIREMILQRTSSQQIKSRAISQGMLTLRQDGLLKVAQGLTTFSEVIRVSQQEELPE
jgi:type IV pilus assembly protein PilB